MAFFKKNMGVCSALYVDQRYLLNKKIFFSVSRNISPPRIYLGNLGDKIEIDELYSEAILL